MINVFECIKKRRSIRKYSDKSVDDDILLDITDLARYAPFGGPLKIDGQLWEFIIIRDAETKKLLTHDNKERLWVADAPVVIACCADITKDPKYRNYDIICALAVENILIGVTAVGLGACIVDTYVNHIAHEKERKLLRDILKLPEHIRLICLITIGYPAEKPETKPLRQLKEMLHYEHFNR